MSKAVITFTFIEGDVVMLVETSSITGYILRELGRKIIGEIMYE